MPVRDGSAACSNNLRVLRRNSSLPSAADISTDTFEYCTYRLSTMTPAVKRRSTAVVRPW